MSVGPTVTISDCPSSAEAGDLVTFNWSATHDDLIDGVAYSGDITVTSTANTVGGSVPVTLTGQVSKHVEYGETVTGSGSFIMPSGACTVWVRACVQGLDSELRPWYCYGSAWSTVTFNAPPPSPPPPGTEPPYTYPYIYSVECPASAYMGDIVNFTVKVRNPNSFAVGVAIYPKAQWTEPDGFIDDIPIHTSDTTLIGVDPETTYGWQGSFQMASDTVTLSVDITAVAYAGGPHIIVDSVTKTIACLGRRPDEVVFSDFEIKNYARIGG